MRRKSWSRAVDLVIVGTTWCIATGTLVWIVPRFAQTFESLGSELPASTQIAFALSDFAQSAWWFLLMVVAGAVLGTYVGATHDDGISSAHAQRAFERAVAIMLTLAGAFLTAYVWAAMLFVGRGAAMAPGP
jgi:hypothetical protein